jgi:hypothetical protein
MKALTRKPVKLKDGAGRRRTMKIRRAALAAVMLTDAARAK